MESSRELLKSELQKLSQSDLIELLLVPPRDQKNEHLRSLKTQIDEASKEAPKLKNCNCECGDSALKVKRMKVEDSEDMNKKKIDEALAQFVGVYMAYSIFHGYLELVLPNTGTSDPNLKELMQDYEANNDIQFSVYKLFLLIPKSAYCPTTLEERSSRIKKCRTLMEKLITRAGVQSRSYKNSVYRITNGSDRSTFVVAEYATPVKTYQEVLSHNYGDDSAAYKKNKGEVMERFYLSLREILEERDDCRDYCELVYFEDKRENGKFRDVADVILERIQKLEDDN